MAKAGWFTVTGSSVEGPETYMWERYPAMIIEIEAGRSAVFNYACQQGQTVEYAVAIALQTDYAGWLGMRQLNQMRKGA